MTHDDVYECDVSRQREHIIIVMCEISSHDNLLNAWYLDDGYLIGTHEVLTVFRCQILSDDADCN